MARRFSHALLLWGLAFLWASGAVWGQNREAEEDAFKLARNLFRDAGDYATAAELFTEFIRNYPDSQHLAEARLMLARAYGRSGRCGQAIPAYETFYQEHPDHLEIASARRERAACLATEGRYLEAARAFEEVQQRFSAGEYAARALLEAGANYTHAERLEQAADTYRRVIAEYADRPQAHTARYLLARLLFASGHPEQAQLLLAEIVAPEPPVPEAPAALLLAGRIDLFLGNQEGADRKFELLHKRFRASSQADSAYLERADHLYARRQFTQAGDAYQTAYEQISAPALKNRALLGLADARRQSRQIEQALTYYRQLLQALTPAHPDYLRARLGLAIASGQAGGFATAVGLFQGLIQAVPEAPEAIAALRELGSLYQERGDFARAISWYRRYLQQAAEAPDRQQVEFALAGVYATSGDFEAAIPIYQKLAQQREDPLAVEAQFALARTLASGGQPRAALREFILLLEQFPSSRHAGHAREQVEYLREFTVLDADALNRALQQSWVDELSGRPRQLVQLDVARTLYEHHDFANAVRLFEQYAAAFQGDPYAAESQYFLAESMLKLARQRQLEERGEEADSLRQLALQEYRILVRDEGTEWADQAELQLLGIEAEIAPDSLRYPTLESGFATFLERRPSSPQRARALLGLADARRGLGRTDSSRLNGAIQTYRRLQREYPDSPHLPAGLLGLGQALAASGARKEAIQILEQLLQQHPNSPQTPWALFELGGILLAEGREPEAIARLQELRWAYPAFPRRQEAQQQLADIYFKREEYAAAIDLYRQLIEGEGEDAAEGHLRRRLAQAYHRQGEYAAALESYRQLLEQGETAGLDSIYFSRAILLVQLGRQEEAIAQFLKVRDDFADSPLALQAAGRAAHLLFALERYDRAWSLYQPLLAQTQEPLAYGQAVLSLFRLGRLEEGRKQAKEFTKRFAAEEEWQQRFRLEEGQYYLGKKEYERALKVFREVEKKEGEWADDGAYFAATALWEQNAAAPSPEGGAKALEAQTHFIEKHADSPHAAQVYMRLGDYQYYLHNYLQAAGAYKRVLESGSAGTLGQEASWKLLQSYQGAHEYDEAHRTAERLLRDFPDHPRRREVELEIGIILKEKGQYARAIGQLEKVLEWAEGNQASEARFYIGEAYQNMGEYRKAIEAYYRVSFHGAGGFAQWITSADYKRAQCHETLGELATAITVYERIVQREGGDSPQGALAAERVGLLRQRLAEQ